MTAATTRQRLAWTGATVPVVVALHVAGVLALAVSASTGHALTVATGLTAYTLGMRHAFDADHIAAIDSTTRRLVREAREARGVGLWFSLGHSTVVVLLAVVLALAANAVVPMLDDPNSPLLAVTGTWGPLVSGTFLLTLAAWNLVLLVRSRRPVADGEPARGVAGGPVSWLLGRLRWAVDRPSRMWFVGVLFGFGFDTATEIALLTLTASVALGNLTLAATLPLPLLFAAGMSLLDSAQGTVARRAYTRACGGACPRLRYDVVVTIVTALVSAVVGLVTLTELLAEHVRLTDALPLPTVDAYGYALTAVLVLAWLTSLLMSRVLTSTRASTTPTTGDL